MNIKLSVNLQLPKDCESYSNEELHQLLSDTLIHYAAVCHRKDAVVWTGLIPRDGESSIIVTQSLANFHSRWGDICSAATFEIENIKK